MTEIIVTMHTLNKYGIPCTDVTEYNLPSITTSGEADVLYMQNTASSIILNTRMKSTSYEEPDVEDDTNPATGIFGFLYCDFHDNHVDYYSTYSGKLVCSGELPAVLVQSDDPYLNPMVNINTNYASMTLSPLTSSSRVFKCYERDGYGNYTLQSTINTEQYPFDDYFNTVTMEQMVNDFYLDDGGPHYYNLWHTGGAENEDGTFDRNTYLVNDIECFCPDFLVGNKIFFNSCDILNPDYSLANSLKIEFEKYNTDRVHENPGYLWGRYYVDNDYLITNRIKMLKNDLESFTFIDDLKGAGIPYLFYTMMVDNAMPFEHYVCEYPQWDKNANGGGWELKGRHINEVLYVIVSKGDTERWYDSESAFLFEFDNPTGDYVSHRFYSKTHFNHIVSIGGKSYLYQYSLRSGYLYKYELENPYNDTYELGNRQLLGDRYIFLKVGSSNTCVLFDINSIHSGIIYTVNMDVNVEIGYHIIPSFVKMEYGNGYNPYLLSLCNELREKHNRGKMYWTSQQAIVAQNHASWCANNGVFSHTGIGGSDIRRRCKEAGIYMGSSENITTVLKSNSEREQLDAFTNLIGSPHHLENIMASAHKLMCFASATYPSYITEIHVDAGMWDPISQSYTSEESIIEVPEAYRGKLKIYVQNFIFY